ncbi:hypothetical protein [Cyclobacterium xiamenense]|uniref:hypothetical protein n=1 Tax=Cyclobacterium xiamenense TaxID=1297121 RepID=UPI0012B92038|nr:hypothetical protein [Cyclobacterium xiamenense]
MFYHIGQPKNILDLNLPQLKLQSVERKDVKMALVDDEPFEYLEDLKFHGFNIAYFPDVEAIESLLAYEVVLCDIKGVGKKFKSKYEGAHVMRELNLKYPFKTIFAFTGYSYDPTFNSYLSVVDNVLKKDIDQDEWIEALDLAIKLSTDPIKRWYKIRDFLLSRDVTLFNLTKLENEYVRILLNKEDISNFPSNRATKGMPQDLRSVLQSFTASLIFKLLIP